MKSPKDPLELPYTAFAAHLFGTADDLVTGRGVPNKFPGERYQELVLTDDEITGIGPIFTEQVLDAPEKTKITIAGHDPFAIENRHPTSLQGVLFVTTEHEDVHTDYCVWLETENEQPVRFDKDVTRISESVEPFTIGPASCEAVIVEPIHRRASVEPHERVALQGLFDYLNGS